MNAFLTIVVAVLVALLGNVRTAGAQSMPRETPALGGPGGNRDFSLCPEGQQVVGLAGRSGDLIDQLAPMCVAWTNETQWRGDPSPGRAIGGPGGNPFTTVCPRDTAVTGFSILSGEFLFNIRLTCQFPLRRAEPVPSPPGAGAHLDVHSTAGASCKDNTALNRGIIVYGERFVSRFALPCDNSFIGLPEQAPRPPLADQSVRSVPPRVFFPARPNRGKVFTSIFSVDQNFDLYFSKFMGMKTGAGLWAKPPIKFGNGWNFRHLFSAGDGVLIAITAAGDVLYYKCNCVNTGTLSWITGEPIKIAEGWPDYREVFYGGDGVIFAAAWNGDLFYYKYLELGDGSASWGVTGSKIGNGWNFGHIFSTGRGAIFAMTNTGEDLLYYLYTGMETGEASWWRGEPVVQKGDWGRYGGFRHMFSAGDGVIMGVTLTGEMFYYKTRPNVSGLPEFLNNGVGIQVGSGWGQLVNVFAY